MPADRGARRSGRAVVVIATALACTTLGAATCTRGSTRRVPVTLPRNGAFTMPDRGVCDDDVAAAVDVAAVDDDAALREVSGVAASFANPSLVWMIADSGNPATVYGVDVDDGRVHFEIGLPVDNVDWEDVAVGPCPDLSGPCVFVADTGDNDGGRDVVFVYAFPEPVLPSSSWSTTKSAASSPTASSSTVTSSSEVARVALDAVWTMPLVFPDDARGTDVEAIAVLPDATAIVLFEKTKNDVARLWTYRAPWTPLSPSDGDTDNDAPRLLEQTGTIALPAGLFDDEEAPGDDTTKNDERRARRITGASLHWSGHRLLLRTTGGVLEFAADDASAFLDLSSRAPRAVWPSPPGEEQGEAIAYDAVGTGVFSIAESNGDDAPVLHHAACAGAVTEPAQDVAPVTTAPVLVAPTR